MNMTVEQFEQLISALNTHDGSYAAILIFTGILVVAAILFIMWWVLNLRLGPLEKLSEQLSNSIAELNKQRQGLNKQISDLDKKIWDPKALENEIEVIVTRSIKEHIASCPYHCPIKDQN